MSDLNSKVLEAEDQQQALQSTITETEYAAKTLNRKNQQIADLKYQVRDCERDVSRLHMVTEQQRKQAERDRNSHARKGFHSLTGHKDKFAARQEQEEVQYCDSLKREENAVQRGKGLNLKLREAEDEKRVIKTDQSRHDLAQAKLDQLYESTFCGFLSEVTGLEDKMVAADHALESFEEIKLQFNDEKNATDALTAANCYLNQAMQCMQSSLNMATVDIFAGGDLVDLFERDALAKSQINLDQCLQAMEEARRWKPDLPPLPDVIIDQGHLISNVLFNCVITDFMQQQRIQNMQAQMQVAVNQMQAYLASQQGMLQRAQADFNQATKQLCAAKKDLHETMSKEFERRCKATR